MCLEQLAALIFDSCREPNVRDRRHDITCSRWSGAAMLAASRLGLRSLRMIRPQNIQKPYVPRLLVSPCAVRGVSSAAVIENGTNTETGVNALNADSSLTLEWTDTSHLALAANGEPTFASLGLGGWTPTGIVQSCFEYLHVSHNIPWWGTIVIGTICVRVLLFPIVVSSQRYMAHFTNVMPQMMHLQSKFTEARKSGNAIEAERYAEALAKFMKEKNVNPLKNFIGPFSQMPFFISIFFGLRGMATCPVESMKTGGILWFENLTMPDQFYGLPILASLTMWLTVEVGMKNQQMNSQTASTMKMAFRILPLFMLPFTSQFPTALLCYWVSTNTFTLVQASALKIPAVKTFFNIPNSVPAPQFQSFQPPKEKDFATSMRESWNNIKVSKELEERQNLNKIILDKTKELKKMNSVYAKKSK